MTQPHLPRLESPIVPRHPVWLYPAMMIALTALAVAAAFRWPEHARLSYYVPYTFLGNSLAPLPYDGYVIWLGNHYPIWLVVVLGVAGTVLIEAWNMELLGRILARDSTRGFRAHPVTRWTLKLYQKAPFWSLVGTCILPIVPHYPMRVLAVLGRFPMWKYQMSVVLGRGGRYTWLAALGWALHIPGKWIALASVVVLIFAVRGARHMNQYEEPVPPADSAPNAA
ncbi:MAG: hypothetical protein H0U85_04360 [Gemmatimonadales bacterium]|nr:hypothetical protein [Gemmatimonadales bacterium]